MARFNVLEIERIQDLVQHVFDHHKAPTTLIVCSSRETFLKSFRSETEQCHNADELPRHLWATPTLRLLSTSSTLKLAFCPDVTHLRAYLATYSVKVHEREQEPEKALRLSGAAPTLAILNIIEIHRPTSAFCAQGLNRTIAAAVEAAHNTNSHLFLAECPQASDIVTDTTPEGTPPRPADPWDEELSILNLTTKRLGDMSVGRTVKARAIAERWCSFQALPNDDEL